MIKIRNVNATGNEVQVCIHGTRAYPGEWHETIPEMHRGEQCRLMPSQEVRGSFLQLHLFTTTDKLLYLPVSYSVALFYFIVLL